MLRGCSSTYKYKIWLEGETTGTLMNNIGTAISATFLYVKTSLVFEILGS